MADSAVHSSSRLCSGLAGPLWCPPSDMIASEKVLSLLPDPYGHVTQYRAAPPEATLSPLQASIRVRQQKPNWHRKVNAHGWVLHSIQTAHSVKSSSDCSGGSVHWPLPEKQVLVPTMARSWVECHLTCSRSLTRMLGLWQWQRGDLSLLQLIRKVILCFQYETFHSKIQSQDFLDSVFTHF